MAMSIVIKADSMEVYCGYGIFSFSPQQMIELRRALNSTAAIRAMRPGKNWSKCPYENHVDDCTCGGSGGDR